MKSSLVRFWKCSTASRGNVAFPVVYVRTGKDGVHRIAPSQLANEKDKWLVDKLDVGIWVPVHPRTLHDSAVAAAEWFETRGRDKK